MVFKLRFSQWFKKFIHLYWMQLYHGRLNHFLKPEKKKELFGKKIRREIDKYHFFSLNSGIYVAKSIPIE